MLLRRPSGPSVVFARRFTPPGSGERRLSHPAVAVTATSEPSEVEWAPPRSLAGPYPAPPAAPDIARQRSKSVHALRGIGWTARIGRAGPSTTSPYSKRPRENHQKAIRLSDIFQEQGRPDQALEVLEPLVDGILNDELWLHAMQCEGELPPRGHGARERVMALWTR